MSSLLLRDSGDCRPVNQYSFWHCNCASCLFALMWFAQVSLLSKWKPRYLTFVLCNNTSFPRVTGLQSPLRSVNVICTDFVTLDLICHFCSYSLILSSCICSLDDTLLGSLSLERHAVSSAYVAVCTPSETGRSAVYNEYSTGPRTEPCGTDAEIS